MKKIVLILSLFISMNVFAEYRAYQYLVKNVIDSSELKEGTIVVSTLHPRAYIAYNGGSELINIHILRTWVCPGNTAQLDICPSPYGAIPPEILQ